MSMNNTNDFETIILKVEKLHSVALGLNDDDDDAGHLRWIVKVKFVSKVLQAVTQLSLFTLRSHTTRIFSQNIHIRGKDCSDSENWTSVVVSFRSNPVRLPGSHGSHAVYICFCYYVAFIQLVNQRENSWSGSRKEEEMCSHTFVRL